MSAPYLSGKRKEGWWRVGRGKGSNNMKHDNVLPYQCVFSIFRDKEDLWVGRMNLLCLLVYIQCISVYVVVFISFVHHQSSCVQHGDH
jgi:hypothetical protein